MESIDITQVKTCTKKLLFSVAELADMINEIAKEASNYRVSEMIFRLHRPMRQFQTQLHMLSDNNNHIFMQVEDPNFPSLDNWKDGDREDLIASLMKLERLFIKVTEEVKTVCCIDYEHSMAIRASWRVLSDFYEVLKGNPRPEYL